MNEEIKAASVDSPEFRGLLKRYAEAFENESVFDKSSVDRHYEAGMAVITHINAWADERTNAAINQLAASRAMLPVTDSLRAAILGALDVAESSLDYRPEFRRAMSNLHRVTNEILSSASPVAGWVSVETAQQDEKGGA